MKSARYEVHFRVPDSEVERTKQNLSRVLGDSAIKTVHPGEFTTAPTSTGPYPVAAVNC